MTYIVLKDTFGDGLETVEGVELDVLETMKQLDEAILAAVDESLEEGMSKELSVEGVVVCEILEKIDGIEVERYVNGVYEIDKDEQREERYKMYKELKAEFEP